MKSHWKSGAYPCIEEPAVSILSAFAPAKINLFLAITGRRADGFHDLVSLVAPLAFGDDLSFEPCQIPEGFALQCPQPGVPLDESNLILRAARLYAETSGLPLSGRFVLEKRIPMGAGLGGGSSDASAALLLLEQASGGALGPERLDALASQIGSDCPLFLRRRAIVMRGRGERVEVLFSDLAKRLAGQRVLLFKPSFGISTPWAYKQMAAAAPSFYLPEHEAEARLGKWTQTSATPLAELLYNNMEQVAYRKYLAIPALRDLLVRRFGLPVLMSGSGSCCFALLPEAYDCAPVSAAIREAWGADSFIQETKLI